MVAVVRYFKCQVDRKGRPYNTREHVNVWCAMMGVSHILVVNLKTEFYPHQSTSYTLYLCLPFAFFCA